MYTLTLSHAPNPALTNGYWDSPAQSGTPQTLEIDSIEQASDLCRRYIDGNGLGSGNWSGGQIHDESGELVGRIAYNGRFFEQVAA